MSRLDLDSPTTSQGEGAVCWVCLEDTCKGPLELVCACPRPVHRPCLARWQLHSAGSREEKYCRFCQQELQDWRSVLQPVIDQCARVDPTMSVTFNGQVHHVRVRGGPGGYETFIGDIRRIFGITNEHDMHLAFDCADPVTGNLVKLNGAGAYQAAVHCATVSAAKRLRSAMGKRRRDGRRQNELLHLADSASSLDMDSITPSTPTIEEGHAAPSPPAAAVQQGGQAPSGRGCRDVLWPRLSQEAHEQYRRRVVTWVRHLEQMRAAQAPRGRCLQRLERTLAQLRRILEETQTSNCAPLMADGR